jgi:formate hydrogenlyase transcriptional activator
LFSGIRSRSVAQYVLSCTYSDVTAAVRGSITRIKVHSIDPKKRLRQLYPAASGEHCPLLVTFMSTSSQGTASVKGPEEIMGCASIDFIDVGDLAATTFPKTGGMEDQPLHLESEISSEHCFEGIIGKSAAIQNVLEQVAIVAPTDSTVLLHGETGTGKELVAQAIHNLSPRRERAFVRMNCAAIPSGLLESELFGHEKGAFTGALMQRKGRFELADRGSLFLDEIGDISLELQPKLLRAVQEQEFERLGSANTIHVNVRMIAATHRDLPAMICEQKFREDLFYRFNVFPIEIPPLRERREDIPLLVNYFVLKLSSRMAKRITSISRRAMEMLINSPWEGNIRQLANFLERAVILTRGEELEVPMAELRPSCNMSVPSSSMRSFRQAEWSVIIDALRAASGRISGKGGAAERLGLKRTTLQNKMRRLGITKAHWH